jgi:3-hydroxy acid dehydrogenase / malonic semialdehyde reductase
MRGQAALITGATAGFGLATAEILAAQGYNLILTGRRVERLEEAKARLEKNHQIHVTPLAFDIRERVQMEKALGSAGEQLQNLTVLINNAGLALGTEPTQTGSMDDWDAMIDTNIKGLLYMTRLVLPRFVAQNKGHVVNVGSVAGRWTYPGGAVYSATKFAVRAISDSLRMDLLGKNIRVTNIEPGMAETEFSQVRFQGDQEKAKAVYKGLKPLSAEDIAETIAWCLSRPAHVNIQELVIFPTAQAGVGPSYTHRS